MSSRLEQNRAQLEAYRQQEAAEQQQLKENMSHIKHKIAVISGKGGVGKSTVTANLGAALAKEGYRVGVLDADIHGPSIPRLYGVVGKQVKSNIAGAFPVEGPLGIKVMSIDFFLPGQTPAIWRGPLKMKAIKQFLTDVLWGELDYLLIDLPPGTGDEPLSVAQLLPEMDGVIIVTMPSVLSSEIVKKAITFAENLNMPVLGVVENMSGFICPHCGEKTEIFQSGGGTKMAQDMGVDFLGSIPIDPKIGVDADKGLPFVISYPESEASKIFIQVVAKIEDKLKK
ncbi:MAG: Mrp/NBP35 family ATP-binding protein [Candidatus Bathyarchaeia archaeon]|jgi:ATP-binding protein involved in chromosome partitioning